MASKWRYPTVGHDIADDGTVEFRSEERVEFLHIFTSKHLGKNIPTDHSQVIGWFPDLVQGYESYLRDTPD